MALKDIEHLKKFLKPFPSEVKEKALWIRKFIWETYPATNELIYDNYNALAVGWSPTDRVGHTFVSFACGRTSHNVHFGFYYGSRLKDPKKILLGQGNQYRYILFDSPETFPEAYMRRLMEEAYQYSLSKVKDQSQLCDGQTFFKSSSEKKRTRMSSKRPAKKK
jgi:hypothetical protein